MTKESQARFKINKLLEENGRILVDSASGLGNVEMEIQTEGNRGFFYLST